MSAFSIIVGIFFPFIFAIACRHVSRHMIKWSKGDSEKRIRI